MEKIESNQDCESLQKDLDTLQDWSDKWLLKFKTEKCKFMQVGHKLNTKYHMGKSEHRIELEIIEDEKDLGVFTRSDLKSSTQCLKSAAKASRIVGMIRRNFRRLDKGDFLLLYKTYVKPHLEYYVQDSPGHHTWSKMWKSLKGVQRAATNLISQLKKYSYEERLKRIGMPTLKLRRARGDMIETYKIISGKESSDQFFKKSENLHGLRGHTKKIIKQQLRLDIRKHFFSQRVVNQWNKLSQKVVDAPSINGFKNVLDDEWKDMDAGS